jgi:hypothetical protein
MICLRTGDPAVARLAGSRLCTALSLHGAPRALLVQFSAWALAIAADAERPIGILAIEAPGFCDDERLAVALVAACQHRACPALQACAFALMGTEYPGRALAATEAIATTLTGADALLTPDRRDLASGAGPFRPRLH